MKKIDEVGYELAKYQAGLFAISADYLSCSSKYFVKKFMNSFLASRMDKVGFLFESLDIYAALDELKNETDLTKGKEKVPSYILEWAGYLLRYWAYTYEVSSKFIFKHIKLDELVILYEPYHSLDIEEAIERINEAKNIRYFTSIKDAVEILKEYDSKK